MQTLPVHHQAELAKEAENFNQALDLYAQALKNYQEQNAYSKVAEALQGRFGVFQHLYLQTRDSDYLDKAKQDIEKSLEIIEKYQVGDLANTHALFGKYYQLINNYQDAQKSYQKAIDVLTPENNFQLGRYQYHLGEILIKIGQQKKGLNLIEKGIVEIKSQSNKLDSYIYAVWLSGAYMALARVLYDQDKNKSQTILQKAEQIIAKNSKLVIRAKQLDQFKQKLQS